MSALDLAATKAIRDHYKRSLLSRPGVTGVGIGTRATGSPGQLEFVIKVYVHQSSQSQEDAASLPTSLDGAPIEVEVLPSLKALPSDRAEPELNEQTTSKENQNDHRDLPQRED